MNLRISNISSNSGIQINLTTLADCLGSSFEFDNRIIFHFNGHRTIHLATRRNLRSFKVVGLVGRKVRGSIGIGGGTGNFVTCGNTTEIPLISDVGIS